jgi:RNA polymerase sigma factor (sigma-70 family)
MHTSKFIKFESHFALYQALISRENRAYDYLYQQVFSSFIRWVCQNNGSEMDGEDAFQKGLTNFLLNLESGKYEYREHVKITTVLFDYCKKVWLNELSSSRVTTRSAMSASYEAADDVDFQADLERKETISLVKAAMNLLKPDCQKVVEWFYIDDLSLKEIAQKLNLKESSVKQKRFDCMEKLKKNYFELAKHQ